MSNFRQQIRVFIDAELSPEARSARLTDAARSTLTDLVGSGRASRQYETAVDGTPGADLDTAQPQRNVTFTFSYGGEAAEFALAFLQARCAPSVSGRYRDSFVLAVNGRPIPAEQFQKQSVPAGAEVLIYNTQPYSRKLDVQLVGTRRLAYRTPQGLFDDAARAVRYRFGNSVKAERLYTVRFSGQAVTKHGGRTVESPALAITPLG